MSDLHDVSVEDLRRLARGLVFDRHGAEDVVQEAWLAALRTQPPATNLGAWLAGAVRNLAGNRRREEARRSLREHIAARPEALPSAGESAARIFTKLRPWSTIRTVSSNSSVPVPGGSSRERAPSRRALRPEPRTRGCQSSEVPDLAAGSGEWHEAAPDDPADRPRQA